MRSIACGWLVCVSGCVDVGSSEEVVDRIVTVGDFAIEERIERRTTFHDPIYEHRWRVRVDGDWHALGELDVEDARGIDAARPPRIFDGHLAVPVGALVLFRMRDGRVERAETYGCPVENRVYGLQVRSIARSGAEWRVVFEPSAGYEGSAVEVRGGGDSWTCTPLEGP
jgi:hypothetical protein